MRKTSRARESRESGQAIVLIVFAFVGLLAFVGIVVDLGRFLVAQTQLRRAVDAAALAGAAQFRLAGSTATTAAVYDKVNRAARASLSVSGVPSDTLYTAGGVLVTTCQGDGATPETIDGGLCTTPPTKKVAVQANQTLPLVFLSLVGWHSVDFSADSTTEAASVDVALVLDISDSMANDTCSGGDYACVYSCDNPAVGTPLNTTCHPFYEVKEAAKSFLDYLSPGFDRVTVIPFGLYTGYCIYPGDSWPNCPSGYDPPAGLSGDKYVPLTLNLDSARIFIDNLDIAIPDWAGSPPTPPYTCPSYAAAGDPRECTNTNVGGGLRAGATELLKEFDPSYPVPGAGPNHPAKERLRVLILLTDGAANASGLGGGPEENPDYGPPSGLPPGEGLGLCPHSTWVQPFCRAPNPGFTIVAGRHISTSVEYDAVDYTLDWADFAMLESPTGNGIVMFTIGLGDLVTNFTAGGDPQIGEKVLRYIAEGGDDGKLTPPSTNCATAPAGTPCGNYYYAPSGAQLLQVFKAIAGRIFTRINQ